MRGKPWTKTEIELLKSNYSDTNSDELARILEKKLCSIYNKAYQLNLHKSKKYLATEQSGRMQKGHGKSKSTQFKKGCNPWNAGKTGMRVSPKSEFKKGNLPSNTLYDGAITIRTYRSNKTGLKTKYKYIRISKANWQLYHRYVWEKANGKIPRSKVIRFIDGDQLNCNINNLVCIQMSENARLNQNHEKQKQTMQLLHEDGEMIGSIGLSDNYIAGIIASGNKLLKAQILEKHNDLILMKRHQLLLNRKIRSYEK